MTLKIIANAEIIVIMVPGTKFTLPALDATGKAIGLTHRIVNTYDAYGNQTSESDPSRGKWTYTHNAYGEVIQQTDANNHTTYFYYDALGRLVTRRDDQYLSLWRYDKSYNGLLSQNRHYDIGYLSDSRKALIKAGTKVGKLNYFKNINYDAVTKKPRTISHVNRNSQNQKERAFRRLRYDSFGRLDYETLPVAYKYQGALVEPGIQYLYSNSGHLQGIKDLDSNTVYKQLEATDAFGNITEQTLGGEIKVLRHYNASTGWATGMDAYSLGSGNWFLNQQYNNHNALGLMSEKIETIDYSNGTSQQWVERYHYNDA